MADYRNDKILSIVGKVVAHASFVNGDLLITFTDGSNLTITDPSYYEDHFNAYINDEEL